jgi:LuxR family transcriptional regulator, maltose regulon positive regulatory protein
MSELPVEESLLLTKIMPPFLGKGMLFRDRLMADLNEALAYSLVLITAPTGYGKTSCLSMAASSGWGLSVWLSLEARDNDPVRFWAYFTAALPRMLPDFHLDIPLIMPGLGLNTLPAAMDALCNQLIAAESMIMVLDDFQYITHADILQGIAYFIDHIPVNFHLVISTRETPVLPINRLRAKNRIAEIRASSLNFSAAEAHAFFQCTCSLQLNEEQITKIIDITQGWAAGIRLMEFALRENPDDLDAWQEGKKLALDYLTSEINNNLQDEWVAFLKKTSVFDSFTIEAAAFITQMANSNGYLEQIVQANLFLDRQHGVYRLHPFFREALMQMWTAEEQFSLNQRAAVWYEIHTEVEKAIPHALAAREWQFAIRLIFQQAENKLKNGELSTLEQWLALIPLEIRIANPDLLVLLGWVGYMQGKMPEVQQILQQLDQVENSSRIENTSFLAGLRCQIALVHEENKQALEYAQSALLEIDAANGFLHGVLLSSLAAAQQALGDSQAALLTFKKSYKVNSQSDNLFSSLFSLVSLCLELNEQGQRQQALLMCQDALDDLAVCLEQGSPIIGIVHIMMARLYLESDQLDEAQLACEKSTAKLNRLGIPGFQISADLVQVMLFTAREQYSDALALINQNRRCIRSAEFIGFRNIYNMLKAEIDLKIGHLAAVKAWLESANLPELPFDDPAREQEFLLKAQYLLESGSMDEAKQMLDELERYARQVQHVRILLAALQIKANLAWKRGELGYVKTILEEVLSMAVPQQYIRLLLEYSGPLLGLLAHMPGAPVEIRAQFSNGTSSEVPGLIEMLTAREMEVLRLLSENMSNLEIAKTLFLSGETVKVHLKHIFQKLEVNDRRQAIRRARELDLL